MLSHKAAKLLRNIQKNLTPPTNPSKIGLHPLSDSHKLYIDPNHKTAVVRCLQADPFRRRDAKAVLDFVRPLLKSGHVSSFVVSVDTSVTVHASARNMLEGTGGEVVRHDESRNTSTLPRDLNEVSQRPVGTKSAESIFSENLPPLSLIDLSQVENSTREVPDLPRVRRRTKRQFRRFELDSDMKPAGDQPKVIDFLTEGLMLHDRKFQTMHGVTGSGKTYMMANIIANANVPTLILAPNKTLASQLCNELASFFPKNRVEYFVSHFKFYQPEAYLPNSDKYIAKASAIDVEIDRLRHAATKALFERSDTIVVASVSSIYGLGLPTEYLEGAMHLCVGDYMPVDEVKNKLGELNYLEDESRVARTRGLYSTSGGAVEVSPPWEREGFIYRFLFEDGFVKRIESEDVENGIVKDLGEEIVLYPAKHFVTPKHRLQAAIQRIEKETEETVKRFINEGRGLEATRLEERVMTDIEMMKRVGFCHGAENYALYLSGRDAIHPTPAPETLLDYLPRDGKWLLFIDESHVTVPQLGAMYAGNAARKRKLIKHGFRLPSAMENRPLNTQEFWAKAHQTIFVSATPGAFEVEKSGRAVVEAVIRPTGVVDPTVEVVSTKGQIEHLTIELAKIVAAGGKAIVTTITKKFAEDVADCLARKPAVHGILERPLNVSFLHSGIDSVGRMQVLEAMKDDSLKTEDLSDTDDDAPSQLDVVVGVNLLREGIDIPAVRLVAILDADSEGFLRGETALIQTIGRAARNVNGHVIMYADTMTTGMQRAINETERRRKLQVAYNSLYKVTPTAVGNSEDGRGKDSESLLDRIRKLRREDGETLREKRFELVQSPRRVSEANLASPGDDELHNMEVLRKKMHEAADVEDFETAALLRDRMLWLQENG